MGCIGGLRRSAIMKTRKHEATEDYFIVSSAVRNPNGPSMTTGDALDITAQGDELAPDHWRLKEHMHTLKYDIIEGHTNWREHGQHNAIIYHLQPANPKTKVAV